MPKILAAHSLAIQDEEEEVAAQPIDLTLLANLGSAGSMKKQAVICPNVLLALIERCPSLAPDPRQVGDVTVMVTVAERLGGAID